jgi:hypothetical protein
MKLMSDRRRKTLDRKRRIGEIIGVRRVEMMLLLGGWMMMLVAVNVLRKTLMIRVRRRVEISRLIVKDFFAATTVQLVSQKDDDRKFVGNTAKRDAKLTMS